MATPSSSSKNTPIIIIAVVVVAAVLLYLVIPRGAGTGGGGGNGTGGAKPAPLPQGRGGEMAKNPGKAVVLSSPVVTKLPANNELGAGKEGWAAEFSYTWKETPDPKMVLKAPYRLADGRGTYAIPAKGTPGAVIPTPVAPSTKKGAAVTPPDPSFQLPEPKGKLRLLLPSNAIMKLKKGDKIKISLQAEIDKWKIPASKEVELAPLP